MKSKLTAALVSFQKKYARQSYSYCDPSLKLSMHRAAMRLLRLLASTLGYQPNSFDVRSNKAGIAVSGEITLHADDLYVQISESVVTRGCLSAMIRGCRGRKDYSGLNNMFIALSDARVDALLKLCEKAKVESEVERARLAYRNLA